MADQGLLGFLLVLLTAAVTIVPLTIRLGLGSVIGYLLAGLILGPYGFGWVKDPEQILHTAEFGVVLLLFLIGLELNPQRLWNLRHSIFIMGTLQVALTSLFAMGALSLVTGWSGKSAGIVGMGMAMSSTAIAMQILSERGIRGHSVGQKAFSVLLFQDLAVIPILLILSFLGPTSENTPVVPLWSQILWPTVAIGSLVLFARFLSRPLFRYVASSRIPELLTALSLFIVVGISYLMNIVGLSMALGTFLAGVVLADSEYRHELEANILPFKGLLLGLFFLAVGMSINTQLIISQPLTMAMLVVGMIVLKLLVVYGLGIIFKLQRSESFLMGIMLSQGGEFAFVLYSQAGRDHILDPTQNALASGAITLSMLTTPLLLLIYDRFRSAHTLAKPAADTIESEGHQVIIAGFGRMGQVVARLLNAQKIGSTVIDHSPSHIDYVRKFGQKAYYGDATQMAILEAAGIAHARLLVITIDDPESVNRLVDEIKHHYPKLPMVVRARDRTHAYELLDRGVLNLERETFSSALGMGLEALKSLGYAAYYAQRLVQKFRRYDLELLEQNYKIHKDEKQIISRSREARAQVEKLFEQDSQNLHTRSKEGWL